MYPSLYMQKAVDKQQKLEAGNWKLERQGLLRRFVRTNNYFAASVADLIREHVRDGVFFTQLLIERARLRRTDEGK